GDTLGGDVLVIVVVVLLGLLIAAGLMAEDLAKAKSTARVLERARAALAAAVDHPVEEPAACPWAEWVELRPEGLVVANGSTLSAAGGFPEIKVVDKRGTVRAVVSSAGAGVVRIASHGRAWLVTAPSDGGAEWAVFRGEIF